MKPWRAMKKIYIHIANKKKPHDKDSYCIIPSIGHSKKASVNTEENEKTELRGEVWGEWTVGTQEFLGGETKQYTPMKNTGHGILGRP